LSVHPTTTVVKVRPLEELNPRRLFQESRSISATFATATNVSGILETTTSITGDVAHSDSMLSVIVKEGIGTGKKCVLGKFQLIFYYNFNAKQNVSLVSLHIRPTHR